MTAVAEEVLSPYLWRKAINDRGACERCPRTERLHAHHKDRDRSNNVLENGELLCVWCHDEEHNKGGALVALDAKVRNPSEETRRKRGEASRGKKRSDEAKARMASIQRKLMEDPIHRAKMVVAGRASAALRRGVPMSEEEKEKRRKPMSEESKASYRTAWAPGGARRIAQERRKANA